MKCIALHSASGGRLDPAIRQGVSWLLQRVGDGYGDLSERVRVDSEAQRAQEQRARAERAERVRRIKEERERWVIAPVIKNIIFSVPTKSRSTCKRRGGGYSFSIRSK